MYKSITLGLLLITLSVTPKHTQSVYEATVEKNESYVPNQVIVTFESQSSPSTLEDQVEARAERGSGILGRLSIFGENMTLAISGNETPEKKLAEIVSVEEDVGVIDATVLSPEEPDTLVYTLASSETVSQALTEFSTLDVEQVQPNYLYQLLGVPNDEHWDSLWGMGAINASTSWDTTTGSRDIKVAVIDSGVDGTHPDLKDNFVEFKDFGNCSQPGDQNGHGTHVAGTVGAVGNNAVGVAGVNWTVSIMGLRVMTCQGAIPTSAIIGAIDYATQKGARVINMSLGGPGRDPALSAAIKRAVDANVVVVVASGNCGSLRVGQTGRGCEAGPKSENYTPANDPNAITVAATGPSDEEARYSSYGPNVDVAAPGGNPSGGSSTCKSDGSDCIVSTWPGGRYKAISGTSMASPHAAGLAALMLAKNPSLTPKQVQQIMESTAKDLGAPGKDEHFGSGRIDAAAALAAVPGGGGPAPTTAPSQPTPTSAAKPTNPPSQAFLTVNSSTLTPKSDELFTVTMGFDTASLPISAIDAFLQYDASVISAGGIEILNTSFKQSQGSYQEPGSVVSQHGILPSQQPVVGQGQLARVTFKATGRGSTTIRYECGSDTNASIMAQNGVNYIDCAANRSVTIQVSGSAPTPSPTPVQSITATPVPTTVVPTSLPTQSGPTPMEGIPCPELSGSGNYDCEGEIDELDFEKFVDDYIWDRIPRDSFIIFEAWRRAFFGG